MSLDRSHLAHAMSGTLDTTGFGGEESVLSGVAVAFGSRPDLPLEGQDDGGADGGEQDGDVVEQLQPPLFDDGGNPTSQASPPASEDPQTPAETRTADFEPVVPEAQTAKGGKPPAAKKTAGPGQQGVRKGA